MVSASYAAVPLAEAREESESIRREAKVAADALVDELFREIDEWIEGGMVRPKRLKLAKPAAAMMAEAAQRPL